MDTNFIDNIKKQQDVQPDETLSKHDIQLQRQAVKLLELDTRLRSLEQLVNAMHEELRVWYDK